MSLNNKLDPSVFKRSILELFHDYIFFDKSKLSKSMHTIRHVNKNLLKIVHGNIVSYIKKIPLTNFLTYSMPLVPSSMERDQWHDEIGQKHP